MGKEEEYITKIQKYNREGLCDLWEAISQDNTPDWPSGKAFEYLVLRAFELEGAYVAWPYTVTIGDITKTESSEPAEQIDGFVHTAHGLACLVECKDYSSSPVNIEPVAKLRNQILRRSAMVIGVVFSRSGFTDPVNILAGFMAPQTILLWDGREVEYVLQRGCFSDGLIRKYRFWAMKGMSDYNLTLEV